MKKFIYFKFQLLSIGSLTTGLLLLPVFYYLTLVRWDLLKPALAYGGVVANGQCAHPQIEQSRFKPWLGRLCCILGQDTLLSQCLSPLRSINFFLTSEFNAVGTLRWISIPSSWGSRNTPSGFMLQKTKICTGHFACMQTLPQLASSKVINM